MKKVYVDASPYDKTSRAGSITWDLTFLLRFILLICIYIPYTSSPKTHLCATFFHIEAGDDDRGDVTENTRLLNRERRRRVSNTNNNQ